MQKNIYELEQTDQFTALYTIIRDETTKRDDFIFCADRIIRMLVEKATEFLPTKTKQIKTHTGCSFNGKEFIGKICAVSIVRSGEAMEKAARDICQKIRIGKILIQRNEETAKPIHFYSKLPEDIAERFVLLLDPMLATGGSACKAVEILKEKGVKEEKIIFVNLISCPEGINAFTKKFPQAKIITGAIDKGLDSKAYILPGLGDFGDRYFGA
ncbi:MAG: uracil phosphoribosyltransferase [Nanoarchaeota archaeon]|nr:uracil phosphoribosyltransferase [Nanoarchaeota archaeon]